MRERIMLPRCAIRPVIKTSDSLESYPKRDVQSRQSTGQNFLNPQSWINEVYMLA